MKSGNVTSTVAHHQLLVATKSWLQLLKKQISIPTDIKLQYKDFDDFFTPTFTSEVKDKDTLKVVQAPLSLILTAVPQDDTLEASYLSSLCESVNLSVDS